VVGEQNRLLGVVSKYDVLKFLAGGLKPTLIKPEFTVESYDNVLKHLEDKFVVVSRTRTRAWIFASLVFLALGFILAFLLILRINF